MITSMWWLRIGKMAHRAKVDSTDIMNISLSKDINKMKWFLNITNLTDEVYERPDTYNQREEK